MKEQPMNHHEFVNKCSAILKDIPPEFHANLINYVYSFVDDSDEELLQRLSCLALVIQQPILDYRDQHLSKLGLK